MHERGRTSEGGHFVLNRGAIAHIRKLEIFYDAGSEIFPVSAHF